ncbi:hypothetical protein [Nocardioides mangrovi]|uniref:DUF3558 domain-containing protein n=1 Tax=Nocardioides mangrovi TaxID=2874580 RepID=A0ABS7UAW7_9ACTN|nr:hypothetical protein [Nocardioides mangrovi]MBZ5738015.1 hypothetical protein [Nocardioides mangrovi]
MRTPTRAAALVLAAVLATSLSACSSSDGSDGSASDAASEAAGVGWTPCDGITAAEVSRIAGEKLTMQTGTADSPRCAFLPKQKGDAAFEVSYVFYDGGLDAALDAMGSASDQLRSIDVDGATSARIAVRTKKNAAAVTGFVETEGLVQSVNAAQLAPYDEDDLVAVTKALLATLAAAAPDPSDA